MNKKLERKGKRINKRIVRERIEKRKGFIGITHFFITSLAL